MSHERRNQRPRPRGFRYRSGPHRDASPPDLGVLMSLTDDELRALPTIVPIRLAAQALDIEYQGALRLVRQGTFPLPLVKRGRRNFVLKARLLKFLEID